MEWLREYVPVKLAPKALAEKLTMAGLEVTGIHDDVLDLEITPNRADCLSMIGIAREIAVATGQRLQLPEGRGAGGGGRGKGKAPKASGGMVIRVEDAKACPQYVGRVIEGVKVGPSPAWMQKRLLAAGQRPINNLVDITNYVLLECGQPLHAFDLARLQGGTLIVRRAKAGEPITLLDGQPRKLTAEMLVIADAKAPVAVAGVMGGAGSEVVPSTTCIVLESAQFDPSSVRRTARALGLATESSYRFERGIDPLGVEAASRRAARLIEELAGGRVTATVTVGKPGGTPRRIGLNLRRAERWLGTRIQPAEARVMLARLSCRVAASGDGDSLAVEPPSFRRDLAQDADLFEELARLIGYDAIPATLPSARLALPDGDGGLTYRRLQSLRCLCASLGLTEAVTWALLSEDDFTRSGYPLSETVRVANPISQDHALLRPSPFMGLLESVRRNVSRGIASVALFEVGAVVDARTPLPEQPQRLGVMLTGEWLQDWQRRVPADLFRVKGVLEALTARLCEAPLAAEPSPQPWCEPGHGMALRLGGDAVGAGGLIARRIARASDIEQDVWYAELAVEKLLEHRTRGRTAQTPPALPPAKRDLSIIVTDEAAYAPVERTIREAGGALLGRAQLIDRYTGKPVPAGKHSLTFAIEYRDPARTLTAAEVDAAHQRVVQALAERFGATLR
jgi:phenylalanyl-tRNA synthetase beta chain